MAQYMLNNRSQTVIVNLHAFQPFGYSNLISRIKMALSFKSGFFAFSLVATATTGANALVIADSANNCASSTASVKVGTNSADSCIGFFAGNVNNGSASRAAEIQAMAVSAFGAAYTGNITGALAIGSPLAGASSFLSAVNLVGDVVIGIHWGANDTAFYFWDNLTGLDGNTFTFPANNPLRTGAGGSSNIFLYSTTSSSGQVPLPGSLALLGLGLLAASTLRRRS
jgi:PEP-CTERM motif